MKKALRMAFEKELSAAKENVARRRYDDAIRHLERAHVLGQEFFGPHALVHAWLLRIALETFDVLGVLGQLARLILGLIFGPLGLLPRGNSGSSAVSMFQPMPISPSLAKLLEDNRHD